MAVASSIGRISAITNRALVLIAVWAFTQLGNYLDFGILISIAVRCGCNTRFWLTEVSRIDVCLLLS